VYEVTTGKWFRSLDGGSKSSLDQPIYYASSGPILNQTFEWDSDHKRFEEAGPKNFSAYDSACTGVNHTTFSTAFYSAYDEIQADKDPVSAAPCWRPGAFPIQIQNVSDWLSSGCLSGFQCSSFHLPLKSKLAHEIIAR